MYVDVKKDPSDTRYTWKSDHGPLSGYVESINFPIYHAKYYIAVKATHNPGPETDAWGNVNPRPTTYTLYASTSPRANTPAPALHVAH